MLAALLEASLSGLFHGVLFPSTIFLSVNLIVIPFLQSVKCFFQKLTEINFRISGIYALVNPAFLSSAAVFIFFAAAAWAGIVASYFFADNNGAGLLLL